MPFDPSGNFTRVHNWQQDRDNGIKVVADRHDAEDDNFAAAFNQVMLRNGAAPIEGDFDMGGFGIHSLAAGTAANPSLTWEFSPVTGFYQPNAGSIGFSSLGVHVLLFSSAGAAIRANNAAAFQIAAADGTPLLTVNTLAAYVGNGTGTNHRPRIFMGTNAPSTDGGAIVIGRALAGDGLFDHAFRDESTFTSNGDSAYTPFDARTTINSNSGVRYNHVYGFQNAINFNATNGVDLLSGFMSKGNLVQGNVDRFFHFHVQNPTKAVGASMVQHVGLYVDTITGSPGVNYGIFVEGNPCFFGGEYVQLNNGNIIGVQQLKANSVHAIGSVAEYYATGAVLLTTWSGGYGAVQSYSDALGTGRGLALNPNGGQVLVGAGLPILGTNFEVVGSAGFNGTILVVGQATFKEGVFADYAVQSMGSISEYKATGGIAMAGTIGAAGYAGIQAYEDALGSIRGMTLQPNGGQVLIGGAGIPTTGKTLEVADGGASFNGGADVDGDLLVTGGIGVNTPVSPEAVVDVTGVAGVLNNVIRVSANDGDGSAYLSAVRRTTDYSAGITFGCLAGGSPWTVGLEAELPEIELSSLYFSNPVNGMTGGPVAVMNVWGGLGLGMTSPPDVGVKLQTLDGDILLTSGKIEVRNSAGYVFLTVKDGTGTDDRATFYHDGVAFLIKNDATVGAYTAIEQAGDGPLTFVTNGVERARFSGTGTFDVAATILPAVDNATPLGSAAKRFSEVYAGVGVINTSDMREKQLLVALSHAELRAAKSIASGIGKYLWKDTEKYDSLEHVGVIAQDVVEYMASEGLNALEYGFVRHDAETDRYSIAYHELTLFIVAAQEQRLLALEALL